MATDKSSNDVTTVMNRRQSPSPDYAPSKVQQVFTKVQTSRVRGVNQPNQQKSLGLLIGVCNFDKSLERPIFSAGNPGFGLDSTISPTSNNHGGSIQQNFETLNYITSDMQSQVMSSTILSPVAKQNTSKSQRQKFRRQMRESKFQSQNTEMINRFDKFCRLVGSGYEASSLKMKFAQQLGVPNMLKLKDQHKEIVQQHIRPEFQVVKESWMNPKLHEPRSASELFQQMQKAKNIKMRHDLEKSNIFSLTKFVPVDNPEIQFQDYSLGGEQPVSLKEDSKIFFDKRNQLKVSNMREHCDQKTYNVMRTKVSTQDFLDRMKITKPQRYLQPKESIPFKTMMKKLKDSNPMVAREELEAIMILKSDEVIKSIHIQAQNSLDKQAQTLGGSVQFSDKLQQDLEFESVRGHKYGGKKIQKIPSTEQIDGDYIPIKAKNQVLNLKAMSSKNVIKESKDKVKVMKHNSSLSYGQKNYQETPQVHERHKDHDVTKRSDKNISFGAQASLSLTQGDSSIRTFRQAQPQQVQVKETLSSKRKQKKSILATPINEIKMPLDITQMQINRLDFNRLCIGVGTTPSYLNTMRYQSLNQELEKEAKKNENKEILKKQMMRGNMNMKIGAKKPVMRNKSIERVNFTAYTQKSVIQEHSLISQSSVRSSADDPNLMILVQKIKEKTPLTNEQFQKLLQMKKRQKQIELVFPPTKEIDKQTKMQIKRHKSKSPTMTNSALNRTQEIQ